MKLCPFCNSKMVGKIGSRVCNNISCRAYEVDTTNPDSYNKPMSKAKYEDLKK